MGDRHWQGRFGRGLLLGEGGRISGGAQSPDKTSISGLSMVEEVYENTMIEGWYESWCSGECLCHRRARHRGVRMQWSRVEAYRGRDRHAAHIHDQEAGSSHGVYIHGTGACRRVRDMRGDGHRWISIYAALCGKE